MPPLKPGGGGKPQPYVPKDHGEHSGEYAKSTWSHKPNDLTGQKGVGYLEYNPLRSSLVQRVYSQNIIGRGKIPLRSNLNSVTKKVVDGHLVAERYYNDYGEPYLDIDYTSHGNPKTHPIVPHIHRWKKDASGHLFRQNWEDFK